LPRREQWARQGMIAESLTPKPGIREHYRHIAAKTGRSGMSASGERGPLPTLARTLSGPLSPCVGWSPLRHARRIPAWMKRIDDWRRKQDDLNRPGLVGGHLV